MTDVLRLFIESLIVEGRIDDLQKKFPKLDVEAVAAHDPSPTKKYLLWMLKQIDAGASSHDVFAVVEQFHKNIQRLEQKDINSFKKIDDLKQVLTKIPERSKRQEKTIVKSDAPKIFEDENVVVVRPDSKKSCVTYGANTKWCITMEDEPHYEQYTSANVVFYFIIAKRLPQKSVFSKVALAVQRNSHNDIIEIEYFDAEDEQVNAASLEDEFPNFLQILSTVKSDARKRPMGLYAKLKHGLVTSEELAILANDEEWAIREMVAGNEHASAETLRKLASDSNYYVQLNVVGNPSTPPDVLDTFASRDDFARLVAANPAISAETAAELIKDGYIIRTELAKNTGISPSMLEQLSGDIEASVRAAVAQNPLTPDSIIEKLATDKTESVRYAVTLREKIPSQVLSHLANDSYATTRASVVSHPLTPPEVLQRLAEDPVAFVREAILEHPLVPIEVVQKLTQDSDAYIRKLANQYLKKKYQKENTLRQFIKNSLHETWWEERYREATSKNLQLDKPGTIVEPDVRKSVEKYLKSMKLMKRSSRSHPKGPKRKTRLA